MTVRSLLSLRPGQSLLYIVGAATVAAFAWFALFVAVWFPPLLLFAGIPVGAVERLRLRPLSPTDVGDPHADAPAGGLAWLRLRLREAATWRELAYTVCLLTVLFAVDVAALSVLFMCALFVMAPLFYVAVGPDEFDMNVGTWAADTVWEVLAVAVVGVLATIITMYGIRVLAVGQAAFARLLITPTRNENDRRLAELTQSRNRLVNAFEAERRRIERDLHDGAQQHLLLLSMQLGLAEVELAGREERAGALVGEAHQQARMALAAIREQIRGIHPQVLTDFGLAEAVRELAERCPVPVEVGLTLPGRPSPAVESTVYFVVSEALTNVVRHAAATNVHVSGGADGDMLWLTVTDNGQGGADAALGTGIRGLTDRLAVMDGTLELTSPPGGPTVVRIALPCRFE